MFRLPVALRPHRLALLAALAVTLITAAAQAAVIDVNGYRFDPGQGEPTLPQELRSAASDAPALYLVQFAGPVEETWKSSLASLGASIHSYIPEYAFVVRMSGEQRNQARALPFVRWIGPYHPAYRISPEIGQTAFKTPERAEDPLRTLNVFVADDAYSTSVAASRYGAILELIDDPFLPGFVIHLDPSRIAEVAALPEILWIEEQGEYFALNNTTKWVIQTNISPNVSIWNHGIYGEGQIGAEMDTGLDYNSCWFRDAGNAAPGPSHRKVIDYTTWGGGNAYDGCSVGHGTHVAGTMLGDQSFINAGNINYNGMAYMAKLVMQDIGSDNASACTNGTVNPPASLTAALTDAYANGARVHSNSWGSSSNSYTTFAVNVDNFMWSHPDFIVCVAAGNTGPSSGSVGNPGTAKNCITVGASAQAPGQAGVASYSSRGPATDGRYKPTLMAPGGPTYINSADNNTGNPPSATCSTQGSPYFVGTSMATPAVAGCTMLVRDYFAQGFYPFGAADAAYSTEVSAALIKALLVNTSTEMGSADQPNNNEGWGRVLLEDAFYFAGDTRELRAEDEEVGLATGEEAVFSYEVDSTTEPLEIVLVWTDYPGASNANPALVNNLNLTVVSPGGTTYLGNVYSGGQSTTGGTADVKNVEECVRRSSPEVGTWTITVRAVNVPQGSHQPFALVTTGSFAHWPQASQGVEGGPSATRILLDPARPNPFSGTTNLHFSLPTTEAANLAIYDVSGRLVVTLAEGMLAAGSHRVEWDGRSANGTAAPSGTYFYRLQTAGATVTRKLALMR